MTLYFRLFILFIKNLILGKNQKLDLSKDLDLEMRVYPNDLDVFRHVNNGRYLTLMDLGRFHLLMKSGAMKRIIAEGYRPHILGAFLKYKKELRLFQKFTLKTKIVYWDDKSIYLRHLFVRGDQICAEAIVKGILVKNRLKASPQEFMDTLGLTIEKPARPPYLDKFIEMTEIKIEAN
jgi:acyl-CoA thioesterase FadM